MIERLKNLVMVLTGHRRNTIDNNLLVWSSWDWSQRGEEWSNNDEWKDSLVEHVLNRYMPTTGTILEIGPGGGRWTEYLVQRASHMILVDLTKECIDLCRERFNKNPHMEYHVNNGRDLDFIPPASVDAVWSWDVFVHIDARDVERYVEQFQRVLTSGGVAVIHHSRLGVSRTGWRSNMTAKKMIEFCDSYGLELQEQFESWGDDRYRIWPTLSRDACPDTVSVLRKP